MKCHKAKMTTTLMEIMARQLIMRCELNPLHTTNCPDWPNVFALKLPQEKRFA
jgi:hypothetical protein